MISGSMIVRQCPLFSTPVSHAHFHESARLSMTKNTRRTAFEQSNFSRAEQRKQRLLEAETELAKEDAESLKMTEVSITSVLQYDRMVNECDFC